MDDIPRFGEMDGRGKLIWLAATPFFALYWLLGLLLKFESRRDRQWEKLKPLLDEDAEQKATLRRGTWP